MKDLETELNEKLENLDKGDLAWINRARSGRIVKWPILVCCCLSPYFLIFLFTGRRTLHTLPNGMITYRVWLDISPEKDPLY